MERNLKFDFLKGLLMFGVVWGHLITCFLYNECNDVQIHWILRTFDMPFFMLISGYFLAVGFQRKSIKQMLVDKATTILLPTVLWSLLCSLFRAWDMFYFLWAVFYSSVFMTVCQCVKSEKLRFVAHILVAIAISCVPYTFYNMSYLYPFFVLGYWYYILVKKESNITIQKLVHGNDTFTTCVVMLYIVFLCFWKSDYNIWDVDGCILNANISKCFIIFFRLIIGAVGIYTIKKLADVFFEYMQKHNNWLYMLILKTGKETLMIYILQNVLIFQIGVKIVALISDRIGYNPFSISHKFLGYVLAPVITTLILYGLLASIRFVRKNKYSSKLLGFKIAVK